MQTGRLGKRWEEFRNACFPANLSKQQLIVLKRMFFAGAAGILIAMTEVPAEEVSAQDLLSGVRAELHQFSEDVKAGRA